MTPDDPRHRSWAGYNAGCRDTCCREAARNYQKRLRHDRLNGRPRSFDITGTRRRLRALMRIGWSAELIAQHTDVGMSTIQALTSRTTIKVVYRRTNDRIIKVYDELSGRPGPSKEAVKHATRLGYVSPLAWEYVDIDDPSAEPVGLTGRYIVGDYIDEAAVLRRMAGEMVTLTKAERIEVVTRLRAAQWTYSRIEHHTGLKTDRYIAREKAAA